MDKEVFEQYVDNYTFGDKLKRAVWNLCCYILFKPFGLPYFKRWRNFVLRMFGARIGYGSIVHATAHIWAPWNLQLGIRSCIGPYTIIYNPGKIILGNKVTISQYAYLCAATHDYTRKQHQLYWKDINIGDRAWVAADAFIGMGVTVGEGAVVGARAAVFKDVEPWTVVGGNPARFIKKRELQS
jgi:putative colanic acid biosynthesis acetyltransferase WcaF